MKRLHIICGVETSLPPPHSHLLLTRFPEKMISLECYCGKLFNQSLVNFSSPLCRRRDKIFIWRWSDGVKTSGWDLSLDMLRVSLTPLSGCEQNFKNKAHSIFFFYYYYYLIRTCNLQIRLKSSFDAGCFDPSVLLWI